MGTVVTIEVVGRSDDDSDRAHTEACIARAAEWFTSVEKCCSRFDAASEIRQLTGQVGVPVHVTPMLCEALKFALAVAHESGGAFDPTVGRRMEALGFDRHHITGETVSSRDAEGKPASWRDVLLDADAQTVTLLAPVVLDLGAVAKGLAVDLAARELEPLENFAVNAGGDLYLAGHNADGNAWSVGIRHPRDASLVETLHVTNSAVCTSGDYERRSTVEAGNHHILDARTGASAAELASVTVVAPSAMVADALATAAFALGPAEGVPFLERFGVQGLLLTASLERIDTAARA